MPSNEILFNKTATNFSRGYHHDDDVGQRTMYDLSWEQYRSSSKNVLMHDQDLGPWNDNPERIFTSPSPRKSDEKMMNGTHSLIPSMLTRPRKSRDPRDVGKLQNSLNSSFGGTVWGERTILPMKKITSFFRQNARHPQTPHERRSNTIHTHKSRFPQRKQSTQKTISSPRYFQITSLLDESSDKANLIYVKNNSHPSRGLTPQDTYVNVKKKLDVYYQLMYGSLLQQPKNGTYFSKKQRFTPTTVLIQDHNKSYVVQPKKTTTRETEIDQETIDSYIKTSRIKQQPRPVSGGPLSRTSRNLQNNSSLLSKH